MREEMTKRGYRTMNSVWDKITSLKPDYELIPLEDVYSSKMDKQYFLICYYNLLEKHLCQGITVEDMHKIDQIYVKIMHNMITTENYFVSHNS